MQRPMQWIVTYEVHDVSGKLVESYQNVETTIGHWTHSDRESWESTHSALAKAKHNVEAGIFALAVDVQLGLNYSN